jgi:hypothetical protein
MDYAVACKSCGNIERFAYDPEKGTPLVPPVPLTPQGHVPAYCRKCGQRQWRVPATGDDLAKWDAQQAREKRATELCRGLNLDGLLKIPDGVGGTSEIKNALSNLLAPLEGDVLEAAQKNIMKVAKSGVAVPNEQWIELYDRAVQKAVKPEPAKPAKESKETKAA